MSNADVYLIKKASGANQCPAGKLALYTNINFNAGEVGDILIISPGIQLNKEQLASYGFILGEHDGVSSVVNNMNQPATLVSGLYLDGATLTVNAGTSISSLVNYPLGSANWNDATNSVVSASVETVNMTMTVDPSISLQPEEAFSALVVIHNTSNKAISNASVTATSSDASVFSVDAASVSVNIPANGTALALIPLTGKKLGSAKLTCMLNLPVGLINSGNNMTYSSVNVTQPRALQVKQTLAGHWQDMWPSTDFIYSYTLTLSSAETQVDKWELSFLLPADAEVSPEWLKTESSWVKLNLQKSVNGYVYLDSEAGHVIEPNKSIDLNIQIIYPGQSTDYNTLKNLRLMQLG